MNRSLKDFLRPETKSSIFRHDRRGRWAVTRVFAGLITCLIVTALLSSGRLVAMAERQEFGESRDRWLTAANALDRTASALSLDRPARAVDSALGRSTSSSTIVVGELAAPAANSSSNGPTTATTTPAGSEQADTPTTALATTTSTVPTTLTTIFGAVSQESPLRMWVGGDSLAEYIGSRLLYDVVDSANTEVELDFRISTGLARPDYYDWPARLSELMQREEPPQVLVFMAGGNDDQDMQNAGGRVPFTTSGRAEWEAEYRSRVALMMDAVAYPGTQMIWVNLPPMRDEKRDSLVASVNPIFDEEAALRDWVSVADVVPVLSGDDGGFAQFLPEPDGDNTIKARTNDGVHVTLNASGWVADIVWSEVTGSWVFEQPAAATSTTTTVGP